MTDDQRTTLNAAHEISAIMTRLNRQFATDINSMMDQGVPPERYAPFINDHTEQTRILTRLIYMIGTWEATW